MTIKASEAPEQLSIVLEAGLVPFLTGAPGIGKSDIIKAIADEHNLELIDIRLSQLDPVDLNGFPTLKGDRSVFLPSSLFPLEGDALPEGKDGFLLFFDEFNSAPLSVQAASYKIILDKYVGGHKLHEECYIVAAGNTLADKAIVNRLSTAMQSRLVHLELSTDHVSWLKWARNHKINPFILSFIEFQPDRVMNFDPNHSEHTFACPRTWTFLNELSKSDRFEFERNTAIIEGTIGEGVANEFLGFIGQIETLTPLSELIRKPLDAIVPTKVDTLFAVTAMFSNQEALDNLSEVMKYIERLPLEYQVIALRNIIAFGDNTSVMMDIPEISQWIKDHQNELAG